MDLIERLKSAEQNTAGMFEIDEDTICALVDTLEAKAKDISQLKSDLKLANDRYENRTPTQWAYDQACAAIEKHRNRADDAEKKLSELESSE